MRKFRRTRAALAVFALTVMGLLALLPPGVCARQILVNGRCCESASGSVEAWLRANERAVTRATSMFTEIRRAEGYDLTTLSVALRQLRNLALTSVTG